MSTLWTEEEEAKLRELVATKTRKEIFKEFARTSEAVLHKMRNRGLKAQPEPRTIPDFIAKNRLHPLWKEEEIATVKQFASTMTARQIADLLENRTSEGVRKMAQRLGLKCLPVITSFSEEEDAWIIKYGAISSRATCLQALPGKCWSTIRRRFRSHGISRVGHQGRKSTTPRTNNKIIRKLKEARLRLGLTSEEVAVAAGYATGVILNAENGRTDPSFRTFVAWAGALGFRLQLNPGGKVKAQSRRAQERALVFQQAEADAAAKALADEAAAKAIAEEAAKGPRFENFTKEDVERWKIAS